ncbi:HAD family hydrolase [Oceaniglobus indicus]|uniref:HAD family hydrolase n=1 Tax=Oceaniglobus indicus TaxID=2047749 RepID=UPI000C18FBD4|nr:HAD family phosphatase [Oceaniglobus indicus]
MSVKAVVFDIGNVLIEWNPHRYYDAKIGADRRRALFDAVDLEAMNLSIDAGAPFRETIYAMADAHPEWRDDIRDWHDNWIEMASPSIPHSVSLLRALRARDVPVFALTNFGVDSFAYAATQYPFFNEFDRAYVSGRMELIKPDPAIYAALEADCGVAPDALLFTDDRPENIEAAAARGWRTHLFDGPAGFAARLVAEGLLDDAAAAP